MFLRRTILCVYISCGCCWRNISSSSSFFVSSSCSSFVEGVTVCVCVCVL